MISIGDTYLSPSPKYNTLHLYIVIAIDEETQKAVTVNITSRKDGSDLSCTLNVGAHPYLVRESVVNYKDALFPKIEDIDKAIEVKMFTSNQPVSEALLHRIQQGALTSTEIPKELKPFIPTPE